MTVVERELVRARRCASIAAVVFLSVLTGCPREIGGPETWPKKSVGLAKNSLGSYLEDDFERFLRACRISHEADESSIPADFSRLPPLGLERAVVPFSSGSAEALFRQAFSDAEVEALIKGERPTYSHQLGGDVLGGNILPVPVADSSRSSVGYSHSCESFLSAALDANVKVPAVSAESAMKFSYRSNASVLLVAGRFMSPLGQRLRLGPSRASALSELWLEYAETPKLVGARYLRQFEGVAVFNLLGAARSGTFKLESQAQASFPIGGAAFAAQAGFDISSRFEARVFSTYMYPSSLAESSFGALPKAVELARELGSLAKLVSVDAVLREGVGFSLHFEVPGLSRSLCEAGWDLEHDASKSPLEGGTTTGAVSWQAGTKTCRFAVSGKAKPVAANGTALMSVGFASKRRVQDHVLRFALADYPVAITAEPFIAPLPLAVPTSKKDGGFEWFQWTANMGFVGTQVMVDFANASHARLIGPVVLSCPGFATTALTLVGALKHSSGSAQFELVLETGRIPAGQAPTDKPLDDAICEASTFVSLPVKGAEVVRPVKLQLVVPGIVR